MIDPTWPEQLAFALLAIFSLSLALHRIRRIVAAILQSRPEPGYRWKPLAPRLGRFFSEVVLQTTVIRHRPLPGLAHAVVFWGFCAFALATIDHVAAIAGADLIPESTAAGAAYLAAVTVFAAAVAVAIAGLAARRFIWRPQWLGGVSLESGWVALLIFALMVTYLVEHLLVPAGIAGRVNWWAHTLALLAFVPVIPRTKHLHLALAPVTVFLKRPGFSEIPPLAGDEDFGLDTGKDVGRLTALQAYSCVECGRCTEHCPASRSGKALNPKEIALGFREYLRENGARAEAPLLGDCITQEAVFQCTTCGACEYQCPVGIQHLPMVIGLRRGAVNTGKWDDDHGGQLFVNLERHGNPLGLPARDRTKFIEQAGLPVYDGSQDYCLWLGCMGAFDPDGRRTVQALAAVMRRLEVTFGVLPKERCTGDAARRLGNDLAFEELARFNLEQMERLGVRKLLSVCPHCVRTISADWRDYGEAPPIEHHSQFLARHAEELAGDGDGAIVFHDPCYLGRYQGVYDEPRAVAGRAGRLAEASRSRDRSFCCGAGGGLVFLGEEQGERISEIRARELAATGAETIAVACPFCRTMFRDALAKLDSPPRLVDIAELVAP